MKRFFIASAILIITVTLSITGSFKADSVLYDAKQSLERIMYYQKSGQKSLAFKESEELQNTIEDNMFFLCLSLEKGTLKDLEISVKQLPDLIKNGETSEANTECRNALTQAQYLLTKQKISPENVF